MSWAVYVPDGRTSKRMVRCALAIVTCITLTLTGPTSSFLGPNVFLTGTVAIYLSPKGTVGTQLTNTLMAYLGFLLGLAWYNVCGHIGILIPDPGNRIWIYLTFITGAWLSGYVRSRFPMCYLGMNFFMLVNIFGLVVAIELDTHRFRTFTDFFYAFTFGAIIAFSWGLLWWESTATVVESEVIALLQDLCRSNNLAALSPTRRSIKSVSIAVLQKRGEKLKTMFKSCEFEIMYSRISPKILQDFVASIDDIVISMHSLELAFEHLREYASSFAFSTCPEALQILEALAKLHGSQTEAILFNIKRAIEAKGMDLESGSKTYTDDSDVSKLLFQIQEARNGLLLDIIPDKEMASLLCQAIDTSYYVSSSLQNVYHQSTYIGLSCTRRRRLHLPWKIRRVTKARLPRRSSIDTTPSYGDQTVAKLQCWRYKLAHGVTHARDSRHVAYAFKFQLVMAILSIFPFISDWRIWYYDVRGHWSMVFAMVVMEIARGFVFRSALMKGMGSILGGLLAVAVYYLGSLGATRNIAVTILATLTFPCMVLIFNLALQPRFGKAGLVAALAYNLVLGVGYSTEQVWLAFLKRTATQIVGILVACTVTVLVAPYHARRELKSELSLATDRLARCFQELSTELPKNSSLENSMKDGLRYTRELLHYTKFEPSLKGHFPREVYGEIVDELWTLADLLANHRALAGDSTGIREAFAVKALNFRLCAAVFRDLYLMSHAIATKSSLMMSLTNNVSSELESIDIATVSRPILSVVSQVRLMSSILDHLREKLHSAISGRIIRALLQSTSPSKEVTPLILPVLSQRASRCGSISSVPVLSSLTLPPAMFSTTSQARRASVSTIVTNPASFPQPVSDLFFTTSQRDDGEAMPR